MLEVSLKSSGASDKQSVDQADWFPKVLLEFCNTFRNVKGVSLNTAQIGRAKQSVATLEKRLKAKMYRFASQALEELKAATPSDTGKTRADWSLKVIKQGDTLIYVLDNSNKALIEMLNYGTRAHMIYPKNAKALHFSIGGQEVFAKMVNHPGTVGLGFIEKIQKDLDSKMSTIGAIQV